MMSLSLLAGKTVVLNFKETLVILDPAHEHLVHVLNVQAIIEGSAAETAHVRSYDRTFTARIVW